VSKDGDNDPSHPIKSTIIGTEGPYVPYPSHSFLAPIGPTVWLLMLDCRCVGQKLGWPISNTKTNRAERKLGQICSEEQYARVFNRMNALPSGVEHLIVQLGDIMLSSPLVQTGLNV
jgi:hypothetical protein